jgi:hypothetical protein
MLIEVYSQIKGDYIWEHGTSSFPSSNPYPLSIEINFNDRVVKVDTLYRSAWMGYFNASIADNEGRLLLYSNGCQIRDGQHKYISSTNSLSPGNVDLEWCLTEKAGYPVFESGLFLSFFNDSIVLLLHQRLLIEGPPTHVYVDSLFYTSVVRQDSQYVLLEKTIPIIGEYLTEGNVEAVKSTKSGAWWVIQGERKSNRYFTILLDSARVDTIFSQTIGDTTYQGSAAGQAVFSPDGSMYARYNPFDDLYLFDFDRTTGTLSNYRKYHVADSGNIGGIAFSPNSRFLYACSRLDMYQFDTYDKDIQSSKIHLGHFNNHFDPFAATFYHMQLGPDCRIYIGSSNGVKAMHLINEPDVKGLDCQFAQYSFHLSVNNSITMPNFPNYRLDLAPPCDTDIKSGVFQFYIPPTPVDLYPNPTDGDLWIQLSDAWTNGSMVRMEIVDQVGRRWIQETISTGQFDYQIELDDLPTGIYFVQLQSERHWFVGKVTKM